MSWRVILLWKRMLFSHKKRSLEKGVALCIQIIPRVCLQIRTLCFSKDDITLVCRRVGVTRLYSENFLTALPKQKVLMYFIYIFPQKFWIVNVYCVFSCTSLVESISYNIYMDPNVIIFSVVVETQLLSSKWNLIGCFRWLTSRTAYFMKCLGDNWWSSSFDFQFSIMGMLSNVLWMFNRMSPTTR